MHRTEVPIAQPCQADWSTMTLAERGRFCGECRKVVHELSTMTEPAARALLASPPTEGLCVRYIHDTRGEIVFRRDIVPAARLAKRFASAFAIALPMAAAACGTQATMGDPPQTPLVATPVAAPAATPAASVPEPAPIMGGIAPLPPEPAATTR